MKRNSFILAIPAFTMLTLSNTMAQDKVEASVGADLVSGYIWRGQDLGDVSIQPTVSIGYKGFSLTAWGSVGFTQEDTKEVDLTLGYATKGFSASITDYWFNGGAGYFHYKSGNTTHVFEAQVGYDFQFIAINWYTNFAGNDGTTQDGKRAYSSYLKLAAPFRLGSLEWIAEIGATPWATSFYNNGADGFEFTDISIRASKEIGITEKYALPLFAQITWNPGTEGAYFVFGLSL